MMRFFEMILPAKLEQGLLPGAGLVLIFAALTLGATPPWARATTELAVLALLGVWLLAGVLRGELNFRLPALFYPILAIFLLASLQAFARLSVYPPATREVAWELLAVGGFFFLLHNQLTSVHRLGQFANGLLVFAFALAVFGILQSLSYNGKVYWTWEVPEGAKAFGPFINRNHYATWALMLIPLAWIKASEHHRRREHQFFWGLVLLTLGVSILLTLSRAGLVLFVLSFPLYWLFSRQHRSSRRWAPVLALGVVLLAAVVTLALDTGRAVPRWGTLSKLFSQPEELDRYRWQIWRDTGAMIGDHPWVGSGLDTFGVLSDSYRTFYSNLRWAQAHNDYVQWLAETGLAGAALAVWFLVVLWRTAAEKLQLAAHGPQRRLVAAALTGCLLALLHSLVDFPLRIPANALLFFSLLALITAPATGAVLGADPVRDREPVGHAEFRVV